MRYLFGDYTLDAERYELHRAGERLPLRPKVFHLLAYLITHASASWDRRSWLAHLWPHQVIGDSALKSCIMAARRGAGRSAPPLPDHSDPSRLRLSLHGGSDRGGADAAGPCPVGHISRIIDGDGAPAGGSCGQQSSCARPGSASRPVARAIRAAGGGRWNWPAAHLAGTALGACVRWVSSRRGRLGQDHAGRAVSP